MTLAGRRACLRRLGWSRSKFTSAGEGSRISNDTTLIDDEIAREQTRVDLCYRLLAEERARAEPSLEQSIGRPTSTPQSVFDREAFASHSRRRLAAVAASEQQLVFGRLDREAESRPVYVGRIGLADRDQERVLVDWRAPVGSTFYRATATSPQGIVRRRTLVTESRRVVDINDDLLLPAKAGDLVVVAGEGALLRSLLHERGEFMHDIVATIQADQDEIIRCDPAASVVLSGGPGTGKSVVALHRTAYLMYERRVELERRGVLLVGPGRRFGRYISRVLPSLGETAVSIRSVFDLTDPVTAADRESLDVLRSKGQPALARAMRRWLLASYPEPPGDLRLGIAGRPVRLSASRLRAARAEVLRSLPSNFNRAAERLLRALGRAALQAAGQRRPARQEVAGLARELAGETEVIEMLEALLPARRGIDAWEGLTERPEWLDRELTGDLGPQERSALIDDLGRATAPRVGDLPLIDELDWLLGPPPAPPAPEIEDAIEEVTTLQDRLDARRSRPGAERASGFGHIVVDEAQDLSPMQWRMLARRGEDATWTIVGDPDQATLATPQQMEESVRDLLGSRRSRRFRLDINYRTPREIVEYASELSGIPLSGLRSIRRGLPPVLFEFAADPGPAVESAGGWLQEQAGSGCWLVLEPGHASDLAGRTGGAEVLWALDAKGLEFDSVVLYLPGPVRRTASNRSLLLIAATRATRALAVVLPAGAG